MHSRIIIFVKELKCLSKSPFFGKIFNFLKYYLIHTTFFILCNVKLTVFDSTVFCTIHCIILFIALYCLLYCIVYCTAQCIVLYSLLYCTVCCTVLFIVLIRYTGGRSGDAVQQYNVNREGQNLMN